MRDASNRLLPLAPPTDSSKTSPLLRAGACQEEKRNIPLAARRIESAQAPGSLVCLFATLAALTWCFMCSALLLSTDPARLNRRLSNALILAPTSALTLDNKRSRSY